LRKHSGSSLGWRCASPANTSGRLLAAKAAPRRRHTNPARAAEHGELTGGFKAVADQMTAITNRFGLEKYGTEGDAFDPQIHEALLHDTSSEVTTPTASKILQPGYKYKERILRPARVAVTDPEN
jgi:molecular chaperone GrpE (heat shock protein)